MVFDNEFQLTTTLSISRSVVEGMFPIRPYINGRIIITVTDAPAERDAPVDLLVQRISMGGYQADFCAL
ncbi:MAG: hypothetical protein EOP31_17855 [Rhodococcus sp. (in: high G+C Gram-positive bacteria)]|uniref:hypothetical protein n=1 Tax=Rhodococcus sp. TaxID=1831 RepID=UPI0012146660|nr:hypothetical protein [Rhodococcus sp. (in: high G+C Gram-positive bacteria)]RZL23515.1 MAG: hypothetical protein EOP31_17855 [Rhodococcus sp. (in: high G+C Gram-positive bacteria)]